MPNQINTLAESKVTCSNKKAKSKNKKECLKDCPNGKMESCCETCFRTNVPLRKCSKCKTTYYCSNECQKYDWPMHKSNCKALEMNAKGKYEKRSGHEYSKEGIIKKDPVKENSVSVDDEDGCEVDSKVGNKNKKKRNRRKKSKNVNSVNIENAGATCKTIDRFDINRKDSDRKASKGNAGNMNHKGKNGGRDSEKEASMKGKSQKKRVEVKSKEDIKKTGKKTGKKSNARTIGENIGDWLLRFLLNIWRFLIYIICVILNLQRRPNVTHRRCIIIIREIENIDNLQKAVLKAKWNFCFYTIFTSFSKIPGEYEPESLPDNSLLVAFVLSQGRHIFRPAFYLQDNEGRICSLIFYHQESDPYPYFSWDQLKPGKYICILEPEIHYFLDEQVGFRIDSTAEVRVL